MIEFNKISLSQLAVLTETFSSSSLLQIEFIKNKYLKNAVEFEQAIYFLRNLNWIRVKSNSIILLPDYKIVLKKLQNTTRQEEVLRECLLNSFIFKNNSFSSYLKEFFSKFSLRKNAYVFEPSISERLLYSSLRNFLMELKVLSVNPATSTYRIANKYITCVFSHITTPISQHQLNRDLQRKYELGISAEKAIIKYEKDRLSKYPYLVEKVEHVSVKDVSAGYDIKSFELNKKQIVRFIEVKAVSYDDYKFMWSRNEMEKAKIYRNSYYLYLLPVQEKDKFDVATLKTIKDPYKNVYKNRQHWDRAEELLSFSVSNR